VTRRAWLLAVLLLAPALPAWADDFYSSRLIEGRIAFQAGKAAEAATLLRIACFGLLDHPPALSEGLAWLALAQTKDGRTAEADATLSRFLEVEKRFAAYPSVTLPLAVRTDFEGLLVRRLPQGVLLSIPTLASLVEPEEKKIARLRLERKRSKEAALPEPVPTAVPAAPPPPDREEAKVQLEKAILAKEWKHAAERAAELSPFRDGEEQQMFYAAVAMYETGNTDEARILMRRAYPRVTRSAFVEYYAAKLLQ
jgi:tetratricopeptide (TPR) repeat protein